MYVKMHDILRYGGGRDRGNNMSIKNENSRSNSKEHSCEKQYLTKQKTFSQSN